MKKAVLAGVATLMLSAHGQAWAEAATIYRDAWGVPHVYAKSENEGYYGLAYALAEDNLTAILRAYVGVNGELAKHFGPEFVDNDIVARRWRLLEEARLGYNRMSAQEKSQIQYFLAGLKAYMADHPEKVPAWAPKLEPAHPVGAAHQISLWISVVQRRQGQADCAAGPAGDSSKAAWISSVPSPFPASNQWAVAPGKTRDGSAMSWADSHSPFNAERDEVRVHAGALQTSGVVQAGMMLPIVAHTSGVAWSYTDGGPDVSDCYEIETLPGTDDIYRVDGDEKRIIHNRVTIEVKGGKPVEQDLQYVYVNGMLAPIVDRKAGKVYAIATPYMDKAELMTRQIARMNAARDLKEFRAALTTMGLFPENVMAADKHGDIYYARTGLVPVRSLKYDWSRPVPGNTAETYWQGFHSLDDLIEVKNPKSGFMVNTNNAPDLLTPTGEVDAKNYRPYIFNDVPGRNTERGIRAMMLLKEANGITVDDMMKIGFDEYWVFTKQWQAALAAALAANGDAGLTGAEAAVARQLLSFDGYAHKESADAFRYFRWRVNVITLVEARKSLPDDLIFRVEKGQATADDLKILVEAVRKTAAYAGSLKTMGDSMRIGRGEQRWPLGGRTIGVRRESAERTLRSMGCDTLSIDEPCAPQHGQRHPILTVFGPRMESWSLVPYGQSADKDSVYFSNQSVLVSERKMKPTFFRKSDLDKNTISKKTVDVNKRFLD